MLTSLFILSILTSGAELLFIYISCPKESHSELQSKELKFYMLLNLGQSNKKNKSGKKLCCGNTCGSVVTGICHRYLDITCDLSSHANIPGKVLEQGALEILQ